MLPARAIWTSASEPFQFLACVREIFEIFVWKTKTYTHLFNGRDATNSGMQLLGSMCLDEKAMWFTNVTPTPTPQDLYGEVAKEAQALLSSEPWVQKKIQHYTKQTKAKMRKREKEEAGNPSGLHQLPLGLDPLLWIAQSSRAVMYKLQGLGAKMNTCEELADAQG